MSRLKSLAVILTLIAIRIMRPLLRVRFGMLFVSRIGHLAGNTECYLCERDEKRPKRTWDIWCPQGKPANAQLFKMYRRLITVSNFGSDIWTVGKTWEWFQKNHTFTDSQWGRDIHNLMERHPPHLKFTAAEEREGKRGLKSFGIPEDAKWVCIINRDPMFLKATEPAADYSYHNFRDSNINNYREAAVALMDRGYWVIRMGRFVDGPMKLQAPMFRDYAVVPQMQSDFMDVYLGAKCEFCISNSTGFDGIPMIFRKPILFVNEVPFEYLSTWMPNSLAIWKHHFKDGKRMTPQEIVACNGVSLSKSGPDFEKAGVTLIENTAAEILQAAQEMVDRVEGKAYTADDALQERFWKWFPRNVSPQNLVPIHGEVRIRIGDQFLKGYRDSI